MSDQIFQNLKTLTFISSEKCNLNCKYCVIPKNCISESHNQVEQAFLSGQYLTMYKQFVDKYNVNINSINAVELWGEEPTLTLNAFNTQIDDLLDWLPYVNSFMFSTNCTTNIDSIKNYFFTLNQYCQTHHRPMVIRLQISFDGIEYTLQNRNIDPQIIINNIKEIIQYLNNLTLYHGLVIYIFLHGVLNIQNIKNQLALKDNNDYWFSINDIIEQLYNLNKNSNVKILFYTAFIEFPLNATKEDGELLAQYAQYCFNLYSSTKLKYVNCLSPFSSFLVYYDQINKDNCLNYILDQYNLNSQDKSILINKLNTNYACNIMYDRIKIRYDGCLMYCESNMFDLTIEDLNQQNDIVLRDLLKSHLQNQRFQPNVITSSKQDIIDFIKLFNIKKYYYFTAAYSNTINLMQLLYKNNQIDASYNDYKKILTHAFYIVLGKECITSNMKNTGSFYFRSLGDIRFYCNGLLDALEKYKPLVGDEKGRLWK